MPLSCACCRTVLAKPAVSWRRAASQQLLQVKHHTHRWAAQLVSGPCRPAGLGPQLCSTSCSNTLKLRPALPAGTSLVCSHAPELRTPALSTLAQCPARPRLQVDYTGFSTINTQRFGQTFVGKVANPHDMILWQKATTRKQKASRPACTAGLPGTGTWQCRGCCCSCIQAQQRAPAAVLCRAVLHLTTDSDGRPHH